MPKAALRALYARLRAQGFDRSYVQAAMLPDWWDDTLFENDSNRLAAQMSIARVLGVRLQDLVNEAAAIAPPIGNVRLKRNKGSEIPELGGAIVAALHAARTTATLMKDLAPFTGPHGAADIRQKLLGGDRCHAPDLASLTDDCWQRGIGVIHLTRLPKPSKKITGLATFIGDRPVIVLCSGRDSPAWLAFHLAHELGHIMCGHVKVGGAPLVDVDLSDADDGRAEREADRYAFQLLTGHAELRLPAGGHLTASELVQKAKAYGQQHHIDPGTVALIWGYQHQHMRNAQVALREMSADVGARAILAASFRRHVAVDELPEHVHSSLAATTQIFGSTTVDEER